MGIRNRKKEVLDRLSSKTLEGRFSAGPDLEAGQKLADAIGD